MEHYGVEYPITFKKSITFSIEHGHANRRSEYISTVVYWYMYKLSNDFGDRSTSKERYPPKFEAIASILGKNEDTWKKQAEKEREEEKAEKSEINA